MAKVVTDDKHYHDIADLVRLSNQTAEKYKPSDFPEQIRKEFIRNYETGYEMGLEEGVISGIEQGKSESEAEFNSKFFSKVVKGDGTDKLTFALPFEPDLLNLFANAPEARINAGNVVYADVDFTALGQIAGKRGGSAGRNGTGNYEHQLLVPASAASMYQRNDDGTVTISNIVTSNNPVCYFMKDVDYYVTALKLDLPPLKTRIEESVRRLPDTSCTAYYQTVKVNAALTTAEWEALMAEKPNCTFKMV